MNKSMRDLRPDVLSAPNVPKPLHGLNPRTIMGKEWWDKQRKTVYARAMSICEVCGDAGRLEAHENYKYDYATGRAWMIEILGLCKNCHQFIHSGLLGTRFYNNRISFSEVCGILYHGFKVQKEAGYPPNPFALRVYEACASLTTDRLPRWHSAALKAIENNPLPIIQDLVKWEDWRLVIDNIEYPPLYPSYEEWLKHYGSKEIE